MKYFIHCYGSEINQAQIDTDFLDKCLAVGPLVIQHGIDSPIGKLRYLSELIPKLNQLFVDRYLIIKNQNGVRPVIINFMLSHIGIMAEQEAKVAEYLHKYYATHWTSPDNFIMFSTNEDRILAQTLILELKDVQSHK